MSSLLARMRAGRRSISTIDDYIAAAGGMMGHSSSVEQTLTGGRVRVASTYAGLASGAYQGDSVVFSCMDVRLKVFSAPRFRFQRLRDGKPSDLFGTPALDLLEHPWAGGTTQDLLGQMIQDADLAGNSFWVRVEDELVRLRPDWVQIAVVPRKLRGGQVGWQKIGYWYNEGGSQAVDDGVPFLVDEVAHFMPVPDPLAPWRGMSWLTPVIREVEADLTMTRHKRKFFENGATPNLVIKHALGADRQKVLEFQKHLDADHAGTRNAYRTLNLYPGADVTVAGVDLKAVDFKAVQGAGETRIAAAAGVPPVIVGLSEGLEAATYSNYGQARRRFADGTMHPLWQNAAGSLAVLLDVPGRDARLWYDSDDVPFLREDEADAANIDQVKASTIASYITAGYEPDSVVRALEASDLRLLVHTGLYSVQLQKPGNDDPGAGESDAGGGAGGGSGTGGGSGSTAAAVKQRDVAETLQKVYLAVDKVITADEARGIANKAGADLPIPGPFPEAPTSTPPSEGEAQ